MIALRRFEVQESQFGIEYGQTVAFQKEARQTRRARFQGGSALTPERQGKLLDSDAVAKLV
jgi:hypothetical protein